MSSNLIHLHQTLHGYSEGHTLLAASMELPNDVKRMMLSLSDMSGSSMEVGFEEYITAYPIKESNVYAIAKTWYAPEMKRPGCVWTHTILFDFQDVPKIANFTELLSYFKRPHSSKKEQDAYLKPLVIDPEDLYSTSQKRFVPKFSEYQDKAVLKALYDGGDKPLVLPGEKANDYEELFFFIWRQLWPRLKRNFSFCTGAISPRTLNGELFDIQMVPIGTEKSVKKNFEVNLLETYSIEISDPWLNFAFEDLRYPTMGAHNFLNFFGSDVSIKRSAFKILVECYLFFVNEKPLLDDVLVFIARQYPNQNEARNLKNAIFGRLKTPFGNIIPTYQEPAVLQELSTTNLYEHFDYAKLNYSGRFLDYFQNLNEQSVKVLRNIIKVGPNPEGEFVITLLAELISDNQYLTSLWSDKHLRSIFITLNPKLTFNEIFWDTNKQNQVEIINQLKRTQVGNEGWLKIINILLELNSPVDLDILENLGADIEVIILSSLNNGNITDIGKNWLNHLKNHPSKVLEWFKETRRVRVDVVDLIVSVLDPNSHLVVENGLNAWVNFFEGIEYNKLHLVSVDIHVFGVALALNSSDRKAEMLLKSSFEIIYFALAAEGLDYHLWNKLEVHTKSLNFWKDWDKCKKIVNAVVDFYLKNKWEINSLASSMHSMELRDRLLRQYKKRK